MILETVDVLGPRLTSFLLLFFSSKEKESSRDAFLKSSTAETLLKEHLTVQQAQECSLE